MDLQFKRIGLVGNYANPQVAETICEIYRLLSAHAMIVLEQTTAQNVALCSTHQVDSLSEMAYQCDIAIVIGGDGNFLNAARHLSIYGHIPLVGVNRGRLGFLTDIKPDEIKHRLMNVLKGYYKHETRFMITSDIHPEYQHTPNATAFNEITLSSGQKSKLFEMTIDIDGRYAFSQRSDGLIIATPTGSTAHSLSAGGPIMYPTLEAICIVPMFPHSLNSRPISVPSNSEIQITIEHYNQPKPLLSYDGHTHLMLNPGDMINITKHQRMVNLLHPLDYDYYKSLRTKLHWSKMLFD